MNVIFLCPAELKVGSGRGVVWAVYEGLEYVTEGLEYVIEGLEYVNEGLEYVYVIEGTETSIEGIRIFFPAENSISILA